MTLDLSPLSSLPYVGVVFAHLPDILSIAAALVAAASAIAAVVPHPRSVDSGLSAVRKILDWLALNVGHATPAATTNPPASTATSTPAGGDPKTGG
jgi:hypothetical protein